MTGVELAAQLAVLAAHLDRPNLVMAGSHPGRYDLTQAVELLAAIREGIADAPEAIVRDLAAATSDVEAAGVQRHARDWVAEHPAPEAGT